MTDLEYLQAANIIKLQSAARLAGLRWKSGTPGYDKAGIIEKLQFSPSIMRATLATLRRMEAGEGLPTPRPASSGFADDIAEESQQIPVETPKPSPGADQTPAQENPALRASIDRALSDIGTLARDIARLDRAKAEQTMLDSARANIAALTQAIEHIKAKIITLEKQTPVQFVIDGKTIPPVSGQHARFPDLVKYLQINRRVILTGSAGTGKSMAVKKAAEVLGVDFYIQTPVTQSHELLGYRDATGVYHETPLFQAYTRGGLILMDESDASLPDALLCANPIFDGNGFAVFGDGKLHQQHPDFLAVFNMNTDGNGANMQYAGRNRLDGATLARFGVRIHWDIDANIERGMAGPETEWFSVVSAVRAFMDARQIQDVNATPRHTKTGALLLQNGCTRLRVLEDVLKSGALSEAWTDVTRLPAVSSFLRG